MTHPEQIRQAIEEAIASLKLEGNPPLLYQPIRYTMAQGGKRLRPTLCMMAAELFGGNLNDALWPAVGLEMFHNFTLVHDDIMDQSPLRRGLDTVYKKWNPNVAILSGDTMFALAYDLLIKYEGPRLKEILTLFNRTAIEVCEGQQLDMDFELRDDVSLGDYLNMIRLKTAVLIASSLAIGAHIGGASSMQTKHIYDYGINIGLAFQLMDDLLDAYSNQEQFGKVTGNDIVTNKKTFLYLQSFQKAKPEQLVVLNDCYKHHKYQGPEKVKLVKQVYDDLQIKHETQQAIDNLYNEADALLNQLEIDATRLQHLVKLVAKLANRSY